MNSGRFCLAFNWVSNGYYLFLRFWPCYDHWRFDLPEELVPLVLSYLRKGEDSHYRHEWRENNLEKPHRVDKLTVLFIGPSVLQGRVRIAPWRRVEVGWGLVKGAKFSDRAEPHRPRYDYDYKVRSKTDGIADKREHPGHELCLLTLAAPLDRDHHEELRSQNRYKDNRVDDVDRVPLRACS